MAGTIRMEPRAGRPLQPCSELGKTIELKHVFDGCHYGYIARRREFRPERRGRQHRCGGAQARDHTCLCEPEYRPARAGARHAIAEPHDAATGSDGKRPGLFRPCAQRRSRSRTRSRCGRVAECGATGIAENRVLRRLRPSCRGAAGAILCRAASGGRDRTRRHRPGDRSHRRRHRYQCALRPAAGAG